MELRYVVVTVMSILIDKRECTECYIGLEGIPVVDSLHFSFIVEFEVNPCAFWFYHVIQKHAVDIDRRLSMS